MTTYAWPAAWELQQCSIWLDPNVRIVESPYTNSSQAVDMLGERFRMTGTLPPVRRVDTGAREAFFNRLLGSHWISAHHFARPAPVGTQRGSSLVLSASIAIGASSLPMSGGTNGATFLPGDMLGCAGQLFQVADAATFDSGGLATVTVCNRARAAINSGTAVTWDKPTTTWRLVAPVAVIHVPVLALPMELELVQVWV